jgi:hypothetical protein
MSEKIVAPEQPTERTEAARRRPLIVFDKPTLTIIRLVLGALGLVGALTGTGVPPADLTATYFDGNPFETKALVIREYLVFWYAMVVVLSVIISIATEVWETPSRARTWRYYIGVLMVMAAVAFGLSRLVPYVGQARARSEWYPHAIRDMTPAFEQARTLVERGGVLPTDAAPIPEGIRTRRLSSAAQTVSQIERLLDVEPEGSDLGARVRALSTRFDRR